MPTYLYFCENSECIGEFEEYHSISTKLETCPYCQEAGRGEQPIQRLINGGGSGKGIVEQSFQDLKNNFAGDVAKFKRELYSSESRLANVVGESKFHQNELSRTKR